MRLRYCLLTKRNRRQRFIHKKYSGLSGVTIYAQMVSGYHPPVVKALFVRNVSLTDYSRYIGCFLLNQPWLTMAKARLLLRESYGFNMFKSDGPYNNN